MTMTKHTIDLLDQATIILLNNGLYAKLDQLRKDAHEITSHTGQLRNDWDKTEQYLALAKLNVHFEQATLKSYQHTPLETKLGKLKVAAAKVAVEVARETRDDAYLNFKDARDNA
jgi:hypothetical protein